VTQKISLIPFISLLPQFLHPATILIPLPLHRISDLDHPILSLLLHLKLRKIRKQFNLKKSQPQKGKAYLPLDLILHLFQVSSQCLSLLKFHFHRPPLLFHPVSRKQSQ
jgi:hypothetical protein